MKILKKGDALELLLVGVFIWDEDGDRVWAASFISPNERLWVKLFEFNKFIELRFGLVADEGKDIVEFDCGIANGSGWRFVGDIGNMCVNGDVGVVGVGTYFGAKFEFELSSFNFGVRNSGKR